MSPEEIDRAIDALSDREHKELCDAVVHHWSFRAQNWAIPMAAGGAVFALFFAMRWLVNSYWPGSLAAGALATLAFIAAAFFLPWVAFSIPVTEWRVRSATRRAYKRRRRAP